MLFCTTVEHATNAFLTGVSFLVQSRVPCLHSPDRDSMHVSACMFPSSIRARYVLSVDMSKLQGVRTREPLDGAPRRKICIQRVIIISEFGVTGAAEETSRPSKRRKVLRHERRLRPAHSQVAITDALDVRWAAPQRAENNCFALSRVKVVVVRTERVHFSSDLYVTPQWLSAPHSECTNEARRARAAEFNFRCSRLSPARQ